MVEHRDGHLAYPISMEGPTRKFGCRSASAFGPSTPLAAPDGSYPTPLAPATGL